MYILTLLLALVASAVPTLATTTKPSLNVPACPAKGSIQYNKSVPDLTSFPLTQVDLCYDDTSINICFQAYNETNFFYNASQTTNDPIYNWEVMETFIYKGTDDPQTYLELEVSPNNVTFQAFIYNPSKLRTPGAPFDTFYITEGLVDGLNATTTLDMPQQTWVSDVRVPLGLFNVDNGTAQGTQWRMNFFRTVVAPATFPTQLLGAWNPPDAPNFHETPFFGDVTFV